MLFSIVTINYNNKEGLQKTIESVISQTCSDYEHIIIDGGSTDGSVEVIKNALQNASYAKRVSYWCSEKDSGVYDAMNKGIRRSRGEYCLMLNSGDFFIDKTRLEKVLSVQNGEDLIFFDAKILYINKTENLIYPDKITGRFFFEGKTLNHQNVLIKTNLQKKYLYTNEYKIVSDVDFLLHAFIDEKCTARHINDFFVLYDGRDGLSSSPHNTSLFLEERKALLKKWFPDFFLSDYHYYSEKIIRKTSLKQFLKKIKSRLRLIIKGSK